MHGVIFVGIQGAGKSTFFHERFRDTHLRLNMDMLRTRHRERLLLEAFLQAKQPLVVDNTNPTLAERARYIAPILAAGFALDGYYFVPDLAASLSRNAARSDKPPIPRVGLLGTLKRLQPPRFEEGFQRIFLVAAEETGWTVSEVGLEVR